MERRQFLKLAVEFAAGATALAVPFLQHPPIFFRSAPQMAGLDLNGISKIL